MPTPKRSVAQLRASGSRHYSQAELAEREAREVKVPAADAALQESSIPAPEWLPDSLRGRFAELAAILESMHLMTILDADTLGRYLVAENSYKRATNQLNAAFSRGDAAEAQKWSSVQDRFFNQCRAIGDDLGMSVSARCRLETPPVAAEAEPDADLFG